MSEEVVILSAVRTPIGSFCGALSSLKAHELGAIVIKEAVARSNCELQDISEVIVGQVLTAGQGQNTARQACVIAGLPKEVPATLINLLCGSSLKSVIVGAQSIKCGDATVVIAVGQESMTQAQHTSYLRNTRLGDTEIKDSLLKDGLHDAFFDYHMGITAENVARDWNISREKQDKYALKSQMDTAESVKKKLFDEELVPVTIPNLKDDKASVILDKDEFPKPHTTLEGLSKLLPAWIKDGTGTCTVGNATGMNDGAAAVVLSSRSYAQSKGLKPLAKIVSYHLEGMDPTRMGMAPVPAVKTALKKASWTIDDVDLFELNEPYAASSIAVMQDLGVDPKKCNVRGGAIALGHPLGASGTRILTTLIYALKQLKGESTDIKRGVASLCIGGGMGISLCIEV